MSKIIRELNSMCPDILWLQDKRCIISKYVGTKAANLAKLMQEGFPIPQGFCITTSGYKLLKENKYLSSFSKEFNNLLAKSISGKIIVRSSATIEDVTGNLFPGIFSSYSDIKREKDFVEALKNCITSISATKAKDYYKLQGINENNILMGILIQEYIDADYSGVIYTKVPYDKKENNLEILIELVQGKSEELLKGNIIGSTYVIKQINNEYKIKKVYPFNLKNENISDTVLYSLAKISNNIKNTLEEDIDIEWALYQNKIYIFQARPIALSFNAMKSKLQTKKIDLHRFSERKEDLIFKNENIIGLKGAGMLHFSKNKWFKNNVLFHYPHKDLEILNKNILKTKFLNDEITLRYSHAYDLGLPRYFLNNKIELIKTIKETWNPSWFAIIHEFMEVQRSFELYVDYDYYVLEHVPGVWESDSLQEPDVTIRDKHEIVLLRFTKERRAKLLFPKKIVEVKTPAISFNILKNWIEYFDNKINNIRTEFKRHLPLNFYIVADTQGEMNFLNIRKTKVISGTFIKEGKFHIVRSTEDIKYWNRKTPILLQLNVERGNELLITSLIPYLPREQGKLYINFGVLSHPAIILREFGINPIPAYLSHECKTIKSLEEI